MAHGAVHGVLETTLFGAKHTCYVIGYDESIGTQILAVKG